MVREVKPFKINGMIFGKFLMGSEVKWETGDWSSFVIPLQVWPFYTLLCVFCPYIKKKK